MPYIPQAEWDRINRMEFTPSELRLSELYFKYFRMSAVLRLAFLAFTAAGDEDSAAIASQWQEVINAARQRGRALQKVLEDRKRAARIARRHGGTR